MSFGIWDTPSGRSRRWGKRGRGYTPVPTYARVAVVTLAAALLGTLAWQGIQRLMHPPKSGRMAITGGPVSTANNGPAGPAWEAEVIGALEAAAAQGSSGDVTACEVDVDRAAAILTSTRMQARPAAPEFFEAGIRDLNRVLEAHPENRRLLEHVTQAKIELAQLRSAQPLGADGTGNGEAPRVTQDEVDAATETAPVGPGATAPHAVTIPGHVVLASPQAVGAESILDPATVKGTDIDATLMPETAEIILPPASRVFADNVRVEGLTIVGASQTLDGIHWKNVTFIGTRLRYEGGEVSLRNVRFLRCTFGFSSDERGARLATAVALGQTSFVIE